MDVLMLMIIMTEQTWTQSIILVQRELVSSQNVHEAYITIYDAFFTDADFNNYSR